jgi:DNA-binding XRE family transcriptional regulator
MKKNMLKNFTKLEDFISQELKNDPEFAIEYEKQTLIHEIADMISEIRKYANLTQVQLAKKAGTTQPVIAKLESGNDTKIPSLDLLSRIAHAANTKLHLRLELSK